LDFFEKKGFYWGCDLISIDTTVFLAVAAAILPVIIGVDFLWRKIVQMIKRV